MRFADRSMTRTGGVLTAFWLFGSTLIAQTTGTLVGKVSDASGAVIAEKVVEARNVATGLVHTAVTDSAGDYVIPSLPPGPYRVTVAAPGFKTFVQSGITIQVGANARVDIELQIGATTESVTVEAAAVGVDTQSTTVGATMDRRRLESLPLNGRNLLELAQLLPGVGSGSLQPVNTNARTGAVISVSGSRAGGNNILLDGTSMIQVMYNRGTNYPNPDAVQEFRVLTNTFSAEHGRGYGGIFLGVTKSGTNQIHGSLFEFFRNDALNARNFFALGIPKLRQNQFGGSLGGPVRLPGYDGRNRTFVFGSYQGIRIRPESAQSTFFPATAAERKGDFSAMSKVIADPGNNQPFPGNIIPANRVDTAFAAAYLDEYLPLPNRPDGSHVEFRSLPVSGNQLVIKGDHVFSSSDRMSIRWFRNRDASANDGLAANNSFRLTGPRGTTIHTGAFNETHIFSPGLLNELNVSLFRIGNATDVSPHNRDAEAFGLNVRRGGPLPLAPRVVVTGRFTVSPQTVFSEPEQTWQVSDKLSWIRNRQSIVAGVEMRIIRHVTRVQNWTGAWDFDGTFTRDALADMMLGRPKTFGQQSLLEDASRSKQYHGFVQDDIKVSRKLTFNLGLRYEVNMPYQQIHGAGTQFLAGKQSTLFPQAARGLLVPGDPGVPPGLIAPDKNNFMPRAGFAWDLFGSGRTALRGAYGIFMVPSPALDSSKGNTTWPWRLLLSINTPSTSKDPYAGTTNPFPYVYQRDIAFPSVPVGANTVDPNMRDGYVQQYNLNLQHQFGNNWIVQAGYVGSVGRKLSISHADNVPVFGPGATAGNAQQRRPYPAFSGITVYSSEAHSVYNSLQVSVNKRFSKGYTAQLAYTFSNSMDEKSATTSDDGSGAQDPGNYKRGERAHSDFYQKHILAMNGIWDIPFAADRGVLTAIIRNWQLTGRARITSGSPFTVTSGRDIALVGGAGSQRPNVTGAARLDPNRATGELLNRYFDTSVFALPQTGSYGNAGRNLLVGPGFAQTDVAVNRRFVLAAEKARFEFRGEIFNLLNNTNFGNPAGSMASPAFGRILSAQDARVIQLGLRFDF